MGLKNILMTYKFPHDKEVQNTVNYYFCDVCHYCFEAESLPDRCPDCGKTDYQNRPAILFMTSQIVLMTYKLLHDKGSAKRLELLFLRCLPLLL